LSFNQLRQLLATVILHEFSHILSSLFFRDLVTPPSLPEVPNVEGKRSEVTQGSGIGKQGKEVIAEEESGKEFEHKVLGGILICEWHREDHPYPLPLARGLVMKDREGVIYDLTSKCTGVFQMSGLAECMQVMTRASSVKSLARACAHRVCCDSPTRTSGSGSRHRGVTLCASEAASQACRPSNQLSRDRTSNPLSNTGRSTLSGSRLVAALVVTGLLRMVS
jgi:hypothetical protein